MTAFEDIQGPLTQELQQALSPQEALSWLKLGHDRFKARNPRRRNVEGLLQGASDGQFPYAAVLGCIDSRGPVERLFDAHIGDLFVARVAGNVVNEDVIGSLEYACKYAGAKVVLVLGHTQCGAVNAAWAGVEDGYITGLLAKIKPAVAATQQSRGDEASEENITMCIHENVDVACATLRAKSDILATMEKEGQILIAGGVYDIVSGEIHFHSSQG